MVTQNFLQNFFLDQKKPALERGSNKIRKYIRLSHLSPLLASEMTLKMEIAAVIKKKALAMLFSGFNAHPPLLKKFSIA